MNNYKAMTQFIETIEFKAWNKAVVEEKPTSERIKLYRKLEKTKECREFFKTIDYTL